MGARKKAEVKPFYSGKVMYMGPDDAMSGLIHAKNYNVSAKKLKSGRIRVDIEETLMNHMTFESKEDFELMFKKQLTRRKRQ